MKNKVALIAGIDGQDGYYLSRFLLEKGYHVYGIVRKKSLHEISPPSTPIENKITRIYADITDFSSVFDSIRSVQPDEIYNLAGQSSIPISWKLPTYTSQVNALGPLNILESIRILNKNIRFFQASSSEIYGSNQGKHLSESSYFAPRNPYGTSKLFAHWMTINFRESYDMKCCSGILFNHESPRRGVEFVTRKISSTVAKIHLGLEECLELGNLSAIRDWGFASDYVEAMWLLLQQDTPREYVIASGEGRTVRDFVSAAFQTVGISIKWSGKELEEVGMDFATNRKLITVDHKYYRYPTEDIIVGDSTNIKTDLGFIAKYSFEDLVSSMVNHDIKYLKGKMEL